MSGMIKTGGRRRERAYHKGRRVRTPNKVYGTEYEYDIPNCGVRGSGLIAYGDQRITCQRRGCRGHISNGVIVTGEGSEG